MGSFLKRNRALLITLLIALVAIGVVTRDMEPKVWMSILLSYTTPPDLQLEFWPSIPRLRLAL